MQGGHQRQQKDPDGRCHLGRGAAACFNLDGQSNFARSGDGIGRCDVDGVAGFCYIAHSCSRCKDTGTRVDRKGSMVRACA